MHAWAGLPARLYVLVAVSCAERWVVLHAAKDDELAALLLAAWLTGCWASSTVGRGTHVICACFDRLVCVRLAVHACRAVMAQRRAPHTHSSLYIYGRHQAHDIGRSTADLTTMKKAPIPKPP